MNLIKVGMMMVEKFITKSTKRVFLNFMLEVALDQIKFMSSVIRIDLIASRITNYVGFSQKICI